VPDQVQWGKADRWSLPVDGESKGSLNTGVGDCEDFVLAKYLVLLDALYPFKSMRILLVHDNFVHQDHAVLAVNNDEKWLILDNRWDRLYEDKHLKQFKPLMAIDAEGVHYLSKMFRIAGAFRSGADNRSMARGDDSVAKEIRFLFRFLKAQRQRIAQ
jgi:hypothetical protein